MIIEQAVNLKPCNTLYRQGPDGAYKSPRLSIYV